MLLATPMRGVAIREPRQQVANMSAEERLRIGQDDLELQPPPYSQHDRAATGGLATAEDMESPVPLYSERKERSKSAVLARMSRRRRLLYLAIVAVIVIALVTGLTVGLKRRSYVVHICVKVKLQGPNQRLGRTTKQRRQRQSRWPSTVSNRLMAASPS